MDHVIVLDLQESPRPLSLSGADGIVLSELSATAAQLRFSCLLYLICLDQKCSEYRLLNCRSMLALLSDNSYFRTHQLSSGIACCPFSTALTVSAVSAANSTKLIQKNKNVR